MSERIRVASTTVLGFMRSLGQLFSIVALQLLTCAQKLKEEVALTRSAGFVYNLANPHDLVISRCCNKITPNGLAKFVLASQASPLTRNFGKI